MKIICFAHVFWLSLCTGLSAQTRYYCYDAAGNRVARSVTRAYCTTNGWGKGEAEEDALIYEEDAHREPGLVFPNPTDGRFMVAFLEEKNSHFLAVYDLSGKRIFIKAVTSLQEKMDMSEYPAGQYLLILTDAENNKLWDWKVVKL